MNKVFFRNSKLFIMIVVLLLLCCFALVACSNKDKDNHNQNAIYDGQNLDMRAVYSYAMASGYKGTYEDFVEALKGDSAYKIAVAHGFKGTEVEWLESLVGATGVSGATPTIGNNGNWWIANVDTGVAATGKDGNGIKYIEEVESDVVGKTKIQITFDNNTSTFFYVSNGSTGAKGDTGLAGANGNGIASIAKTGTEGLVDTYTITFTDNTTTTFTVINGANGTNGTNGINGINGQDGNGIASIAKTGTEGLVDTYTINFTNGDHSTFTVTNGTNGINGTNGTNGQDGVSIISASINDNGALILVLSEGDPINVGVVVGAKGDKGDQGTSITEAKIVSNNLILTIGEDEINLGNVKGADGLNGTNGQDGNGIASIVKTETEGLVDTYTITFTNGQTTTFTVTNGAAGGKGDKGETGNGVASIIKTETEGLVDTYTITYTNGDTATFTVTNGAQGIQGIQGIQGEAGHTSVITIQNGNWYIDGEDTHQAAQGIQGETGNGISLITKTGTEGLVDTYTITFTNGQTTTFTVTNGAQGVSVSNVEIGENGHLYVTLSNGGDPIDCGVVKDVHVHSYGDWIVLKPETCTEKGLKSHVCSICGIITGEEINPTGHNYVDGVCTYCHGEQDFTVTFMVNDEVVDILHFTVSTSPSDDDIPDVPSKAGYSGVWDVYNFTNLQNQTVNAIYTANTYIVTLNANGGNCSAASIEATYNSALVVPTPTRSGYDFNGWYEESALFTSGDTYTYTEAITLTADWIAKTYTITLNTNGGECTSSSVQATYDSAITLPTPTKSGYSFLGWYRDSSLYQTGDIYSNPMDITLVASWEEIFTGTYITDANGLQSMSTNGNYALKNNIDFGGANWQTLAVLTGTIDGRGYTISNIVITNGFIGENSGMIKNLNISNATVSSSNERVGILTQTNNGTIDNCSVQGTITASSNYVGGLVGYNTATITNSSANTSISNTVSTPGIVKVGGLVGYSVGTSDAHATMTNCFAQSGAEDIVSTLISSGSSQTVLKTYMGGLVGDSSYTDYSKVYATTMLKPKTQKTGSDETSTNNSGHYSGYTYVGGLLGNIDNCTISNSYASSPIDSTISIKSYYAADNYMAYGSATSYAYVGGFAGYAASSTITNCYSDGTIANKCVAIATYFTSSYIKGIASSNSYVGGFVGYASSASATNCFSSQGSPTSNTVTATSYNNSYSTINNNYGGFYGWTSGLTVTNSYRNSVFSSSSTNGTSMALADMQTTNFIYTTLGWSNELWSETNGNLPTLI